MINGNIKAIENLPELSSALLIGEQLGTQSLTEFEEKCGSYDIFKDSVVDPPQSYKPDAYQGLDETFIEISKSNHDNNASDTPYKSMKFDFGTFAKYVLNSIEYFKDKIGKSFLTEEAAAATYVPLSGYATMSGPLAIKLENSDSLKDGAYNYAALLIDDNRNSTDDVSYSGLIASKANIADLTASSGNIRRLSATRANIDQLTAVNSTFDLNGKSRFNGEVEIANRCTVLTDSSLSTHPTGTVFLQAPGNNIRLNGGNLEILGYGEIQFVDDENQDYRSSISRKRSLIDSDDSTNSELAHVVQIQVENLLAKQKSTDSYTSKYALEVAGDAKIKGELDNTSYTDPATGRLQQYTALFSNIDVERKSTFNKVLAEEFIGENYRVCEDHEAETVSMKADNKWTYSEGFVQTDKAAQLTAVAAYWS